MTKKEFITRWRKAKLPRLYWKSANRRWRWDSDVIARTADMYFTGWEGLEEFLTYCEELEASRNHVTGAGEMGGEAGQS